MIKKKFLITDIDGTFFRSSLLIELLEEFIKTGLINADARNMYSKEHKAWHDRRGSYNDYIVAIVGCFEKNIIRIHHDDLVKASKEVVERNTNKVYHFTRSLIIQAKKDGYFLIIISHSPQIILDIFGEKYGFDKVYGMTYEESNSRFTGKT